MIPVWKYGRPADGTPWDTKYRAEGLPSKTADEYLRQPYVQTMLCSLRPGMRVLDAGCGTGGLVWFLLARGFDVSGIDASPAAIEIARRAAPEADLRVATVEQLPFPEASFDAYLAIGSWEYPERGPDVAAHEAARVLKPGGLAFIEVPQLSALRRLLYVPLKRIEYRLRKTIANTRCVQRLSHHLFSVTEMRALLTQHGFDVLEVHHHDLPEVTRHYGLWVDWPFLRARANPAKSRPQTGRSGAGPYELNALGRVTKTIGNAISPWTIATGMFIVARKQ